MVKLICPLATCMHPVPRTIPPTLQVDIIDHLFSAHNIAFPEDDDGTVLADLRLRQDRVWHARYERLLGAVRERCKSKPRRAEWRAFVQDPREMLLPGDGEKSCGEELMVLRSLAGAWDDEAHPRSKQKAADMGGASAEAGKTVGGRKEGVVRNDSVAKAKIERLVRYVEESRLEEDGGRRAVGPGLEFGVRKSRE